MIWSFSRTVWWRPWRAARCDSREIPNRDPRRPFTESESSPKNPAPSAPYEARRCVALVPPGRDRQLADTRQHLAWVDGSYVGLGISVRHIDELVSIDIVARACMNVFTRKHVSVDFDPQQHGLVALPELKLCRVTGEHPVVYRELGAAGTRLADRKIAHCVDGEKEAISRVRVVQEKADQFRSCIRVFYRDPRIGGCSTLQV